MEGWTWKALCNEMPFRFGKNLASSRIRTRDPVIRSRDANRSTTRTLHDLKSLYIGIKHGFPCINICQVPREVLKTKVEDRGF